MPEGDTIAKLATSINNAAAGRVVERTITRDPRLVGVNLDGTTLSEAANIGKCLMLRFKPPSVPDGGMPIDEPMTLFSHLHMDGEWRLGATPRIPRWRRRVELNLGGTVLTAIDMPEVGLLPTADEDAVVGHLGPNLCGPVPPDPCDVAQRLSAEPATPLAGALLDQRRVAGFGNVFAVELPFLAGLCPLTPVGDIEFLDDLVRVGVALIRWSGHGRARNTTGRNLRTADHYLYRGPPRSTVRPTGTARAGAALTVKGRADALSGFRETNERCRVCGERLWFAGADDTPWGRIAWSCPLDQPDERRSVDSARLRRLLALHPAVRPST